MGGALPGACGRAARARAGRARLRALAAAGLGAGAGRAVLGGAEGRRGDPPAGDDALAVAAVLRVLRHLELRARHSRGATRRHAQPERDPLADVAGVDRARGRRARLGGGAARAALGLARPHRGHGVDVDARRRWRLRASSLPDRRVVVASEHAHSSVEKAVKMLGLELRRDAGRRRLPASPRRSRPRRRVRGRRDGRDDVDGVGRSGAGDRGRVRARGRLAPRRRRVRRLGHGLPGAALGVRGGRTRRLARRQRAQVDARARRLLAACGAGGRRRCARPSASFPSTSARRTTSSRSATTARRSGAGFAR